MIVDTSAMVAIVLREPDHEAVLATLTQPATAAGMGTPTIAELGVVLSARLAGDARRLVADLLQQLEIAEVHFTEAHWRAAVEAFWRYGRGRHRAALNFGDCLSYAVAHVAGEALLFAGEDFAATDLTPA
ncbi:MAG TPA: type II toxin-antitoxin system VapC family toxin [Acidimicrobiales bacterium]|nr:type II toxin-antitoxin system VapC family toxin [Acidimicrobiales bacterium]